MIDAAIGFANSQGIKTYKIDDTLSKKRGRNIEKLKKMISDVEDERLGVRFTKDDIDIMAPIDWNEDQIAEYSLGAFWIIATGIVVASAVIAYGRWLYEREQEATKDYNRVLNVVDNKFCNDPNSAICRTWTNLKKLQNFEPKKTTIKILEDGISSAVQSVKDTVQSVKTSAIIGLAIAIPLILFSFLGNRK